MLLCSAKIPSVARLWSAKIPSVAGERHQYEQRFHIEFVRFLCAADADHGGARSRDDLQLHDLTTYGDGDDQRALVSDHFGRLGPDD